MTMTEPTSIEAEVAALRDKIRALQAERKQLDSTPCARADVRKRVAGSLTAAHAQAVKDFRHDLTLVSGGDFPRFFRDQSANVGGLLALAAGGVEPLMKKLEAFINELPEGIADDARVAHADEIEAALQELEIAEEALIEQAEAVGEFIPRRAEARPEIVLGDHEEVELKRSERYQCGNEQATPRRRQVVQWSPKSREL